MKNIISVYEASGGRGILTGLMGKKLYLKFVEYATPYDNPEILFLDFTGVIATGSFFREAVFQFRDYCVSRRFNLFPVLANLNEETLEELKSSIELSPNAIIICTLNKKGEVEDTRLIGILEDKQQITLEAVLKEKEVDAVTLSRNYQEEKAIGVTGWNNRLSSLASKGLIVQRKRGRSKLYTPIMEML